MTAAKRIPTADHVGILEGNLQNIFDALFYLGVIDDVLDMDWDKAMDAYPNNDTSLVSVLEIANHYQYDLHILIKELQQFDEKTLGFLAMEVAREYADFHSRKGLH